MRRNFPPPSFSTTTTTNTTTSPNTDRSSSSTSSSPSSSWYEGYVNLTVDLLWRGSLLQKVNLLLISLYFIQRSNGIEYLVTPYPPLPPLPPPPPPPLLLGGSKIITLSSLG
eukprot:scaffold326_cov169-Ochromonas_danica.AAC.16